MVGAIYGLVALGLNIAFNATVAVAGAIVLALHLFFGRTLLGRAMRAVASDREAARLMGIDVGRIVMLSFALSAAVGAIGGLIVTPVTLTIYDAGTMLGLKGFAAAVTGGLGNTFWGIARGLGLGLPRGFVCGVICSEVKDGAAFLLLLLLVFVRPAGL